MKQMVCSVCSYTYDEAKGIPEAGIAPGTKWEELPEDWKCPWCGAGKDAFREKTEKPEPAASKAPSESMHKEPAQEAQKGRTEGAHEERELSAMEMSIICSNLARGCEKQYLFEEMEGFQKLAEFFRRKAEPEAPANVQAILERINGDLSERYPAASDAASMEPDRGALRALVWSEKVTRMLQSLLARYVTQGDRMLENTGVFVCTICGFVYIGDTPPELCPVCKVPGWRFEKAERRAS